MCPNCGEHDDSGEGVCLRCANAQLIDFCDGVIALQHALEARWIALRKCCESGAIYEVANSVNAVGDPSCICCSSMVGRFLTKMRELERASIADAVAKMDEPRAGERESDR